MDYEKKYKDLVEAVKMLKEANPSDEGIQNWVKDNVPELQKSEDERIRKAIYIYLDWLEGRKDYAPKGKYSIRDMLAWLEKQGEQKTPIWKHWKDGIAGNGEGKPIYLIKYGHTYSLSLCLCFECDYVELSELDKLLSEKQGEQKPADKVEPKFNIGDIIFNKKTKEQFTITGRSLALQYYHDEDHLHEVRFTEQDEWEIIKQKFHEGDWIINLTTK